MIIIFSAPAIVLKIPQIGLLLLTYLYQGAKTEYQEKKKFPDFLYFISSKMERCYHRDLMIKDDTVRWWIQKIALFYHVFPFSKQLTKQAAEKTD